MPPSGQGAHGKDGADKDVADVADAWASAYGTAGLMVLRVQTDKGGSLLVVGEGSKIGDFSQQHRHGCAAEHEIPDTPLQGYLVD